MASESNVSKFRRPRIGLLVSHIIDEFDSAVCSGAMTAAEQADVNLVIFPGRYIDGVYADKIRTEYEYQYNTLFELPKYNKFDILLVLIGTIGSHLTKEQQKEFLDQYKGVPIITISSHIEGYNCISVDNTTGLKDAIEHIIKRHGCRNIGFVSGPKTSDDAVERLNVFRETLEENGIPFDENKVVYGNFSKYVKPEIEELLDRDDELNAIVFANDQMAIAGYEVLEARGMKPGFDISVIGFDNDPVAEELIPPLTTVNTNASELGFNAVMEAVNFLNNGMIDNDTIPSSMVLRNSCGCNGIPRLRPTDLKKKAEEREDTADEISSYLVNRYRQSQKAEVHRQNFKKFYMKLDDYFHSSNPHDRYKRDDLIITVDSMLGDDFFKYVTLENLYTVIEHIHNKYTALNTNMDEHLMLNRLFIQIYKVIAERNAAYCKYRLYMNSRLSWHVNSITRDMLMFDAYDDHAYQTVVDKLSRLKMRSSYLFVHEPTIINRKNDIFKLPDTLYLKSYHNGGDAILLDRQDQKTDPREIFTNKYLPSDRRYTMIVSVLFSNEEHYGLLLCETEHEKFDYIRSINSQLAAALQIINLMKKEARTHSMLQQSLIEIKENNQLLSDLSKTDELTGCYNRRGFFEEVRSRLKNEGHISEENEAVMIFADLDNLKTINDHFGHEEGDFAIRSTAEILRRAFDGGIFSSYSGNKEILGRLGGDEFVVCAFPDEPLSITAIREQIESLTRQYNEELAKEKPYIIHASVGVYPFKCTETVEIGELLSHADSLLYAQKRNKKPILKEDIE